MQFCHAEGLRCILTFKTSFTVAHCRTCLPRGTEKNWRGWPMIYWPRSEFRIVQDKLLSIEAREPSLPYYTTNWSDKEIDSYVFQGIWNLTDNCYLIHTHTHTRKKIEINDLAKRLSVGTTESAHQGRISTKFVSVPFASIYLVKTNSVLLAPLSIIGDIDKMSGLIWFEKNLSIILR